MLRATLKGLVAHRLRLALTALSVVLGVAFVTGTYVLTDTLKDFFDSVFSEASSGRDVVIQSAAGTDEDNADNAEPIDEALVDQVRAVPGVRLAEGVTQGFAQIVGRDGKPAGGQGPPTLGFSWGPETELSPLTLRSGTRPDAPGEVAIDALTARKQHFVVGQRVKVLFSGPAQEFTLTAIVGFGKSDNLGGATIAAFDPPVAQQFLGRPGKVDLIGVAADSGTQTPALVERLNQVLPKGVEAKPSQEVAAQNAGQIKKGISFFGTGLLFFAGIALFVGAFIIANTFSIIVAQRTRELALLRALGASGRQVMGSVMGEAFVIGTIASVIGIGAGLGVGVGLRVLVQAISGGADLPGAGILLLPRTVIIGLVVGIGTTVLSSIAPARRAARLSPVAAMRGEQAAEAASPRRRIFAAAGAGAVGGLLLWRGLFGHDVALRFGIIAAGAVLLFIAMALASALATGRLATIIGAPMARVGRMPGQLARANAARNPQRTAATAAALMVGLGMVTAIAVMGASIKTSVNEILDNSFTADLIVIPGRGSDAGFSPEAAVRVRRVDGVAHVASFRFGRFRSEGRRRGLVSVEEADLAAVTDLDMKSGSIADLADGGVLIHSDIATKRGLKVGGFLAMELPRGSIRPRVDGIYGESRVVGASYVLSRRDYEQGYTEQLDNGLFVKAAPGVDVARLAGGVKAVLTDLPNLEVRDQSEFKKESAANVNQLLALVSALLLLAIVIALLGIANTLALSVFERTRELGLLRAVGMSRRQTRRMVRYESVIVAIIGALLGIAVGLVFGILIVKSLADDGIERLTVPGGQLVSLVVLAALAGVLAAIFPARRAARLDVLAAIATE